MENHFQKNEFLGQVYVVISVLFFGSTISALNSNLKDPFSAPTLYLFMILTSLCIAYWQKLIIPLIVSVLGIFIWTQVQNREWINLVQGSQIGLTAIMFFTSIIFYIVGRLHLLAPKFRRFGNVYIFLGLITSCIMLFYYTMNFGAGQFLDQFEGQSIFKSYSASYFHLLAFGTIIILVGYGFIKKSINIYEIAILGVMTVFFGLATIIPAETIKNFLMVKSGDSLIVPLFFNVLFLLEAVGIVYLALTRKIEWVLSIGLVFIALYVFAKILAIFSGIWSASVYGLVSIVSLILVGTVVKIIANYKSDKSLDEYSKTIYYVTSIFVTLSLLFISNHSWADSFIKNIQGYTQGSIQNSIATVCFLLLTVLSVYYASLKQLTHQIETTFYIIFILFIGIVINIGLEPNEYITFILSILLSVIGLIQIIITIFKGYFYQDNNLINIGAVFMFIFIFFKYFDWFYSFMDKSIFFIIAGIMLFVLGYFMDKGRRYMIENIKKEV